MVTIPERVAKRASTRYEVDPASGCWVSTYSVASHGYAQVGWREGRERWGTTAHRAAWVHAHGQIPDGMTVDHMRRSQAELRRVSRPVLATRWRDAATTAATNGRTWHQ